MGPAPDRPAQAAESPSRALHPHLPARIAEPPPRGTVRARWVVASLRRKLLWMTLLRVVTLSFLAVATAVLSDDEGGRYLDDVRGTLLGVALVFMGPSLLYFPFVILSRSKRVLSAVASVQILQDCVFAACLVAATGGTGSAFTFFFSLTVVLAGILVARFGTILAVASSVLCMLPIALIETGYLKGPSFLSNLLVPASTGQVLYAYGINVVAFIGIGFLSSYLSEALRRSDVQRERYKVNFEDLRQVHESILVSIESGIITCQMDDRIQHMNLAAERMLGVEFVAVRGKALASVMPTLGRAVGAGRSRFELEVGEGGEREPRWVLVTVSPFLSQAGDAVGRIVVLEDISILKRMQARMKADERLATIGKLAAVVAHEIRNPLAAISASSQMLAMSPDLANDNRVALDIIVREADRLNLWITDLLEYARPRKGEVLSADLAELLGQIVDLLRNDPATAGVEVSQELARGLVIRGDVQRLHRVFMNLAKNGIEALEGEGHLRISSWADWENGRRVAVVSVADNGPGIAGEDIGRVFDVFFTTKPGGSGLGLATVVQIVEEHGGRVTVESTPGVRTEFRVVLPIPDDPREAGEGADA